MADNAASDPATSFDVVVLGSGVSGLTAAVTAALEGLRVAVFEHAPDIGGTSARSSGTVWIPDNGYLREMGIEGDRERAQTYLGKLIGERSDARIWSAFLDHGPAMLADLGSRAGLRFSPLMNSPDYRQDCDGAAPGGRAIAPMQFDGRTLGKDFERLAWPLPELMLFGRMMITRDEAALLVRSDRSLRGATLGIRLLTRYLWDRLRHSRGTRLVLGNALVARLLKVATELGVQVHTRAEPRQLIVRACRVAGVEIERDGRKKEISARLGVILAGGGFPSSQRWRSRELPSPTPLHTPAAPGADGSTIDLAVQAGAALGPSGLDNALWFPSSVAQRQDGTTAIYPHIVLDRAKPGLIAVDKSGRRFVNEAVSYHEFVRGMYRANPVSGSIPAWLVCDRAFIHRYGLGMIRPRTPSLRQYVAQGYLFEAATISELARRTGVSPEGLAATVERWNGFLRTGIDEDFSKGGTIYERGNGDLSVSPNPCLGPIAKAPFYAVAVWPTPLGTSRGLAADVHARVLDEANRPIPGLYVCGNDMQSAFGGEYPGGGAQLGQGMTFGWIAARHAAHASTNPNPEVR